MHSSCTFYKLCVCVGELDTPSVIDNLNQRQEDDAGKNDTILSDVKTQAIFSVEC